MTPPVTGVQVRLNGAWVPLGSTPPPPPDTNLFPGDPGSGKICWGICRQGGMPAVAARAAQFASDVGQSGHLYPKTGRIYITPFSTLSAGVSQAQAALSDAALVKAWGGIPFIDSKELSGTNFSQVGSGSMDQVIDTLMEGALAMNWPIIIGYHQEPVGDGLGGAVEYGQAVARFQARKQLAGATNVSVTGCIGFGAFPGNGDPTPWFQELAAPSDVWGSHKYLQYKSQDEAKWANGWSMHQLFGQYWDIQETIDDKKARVHGEWGVHTRSANLATAPQFMDQFMTFGISYRLRVANFFDSGLNSNAGGAWTLDIPIQGGDGSVDPSRRAHMASQLLDSRASFPSAL